jgi:hypothetical protein
MNEKQFVTATLFAMVLLTLIFIPTAHQQGSGAYDPWLDYNEDGKIDVNELNPLGQAYGATGDPTKNVTITGHRTNTYQLAVAVSVPSGGVWDSGIFWVDGYSKVTVLLNVNPASTANLLRIYALDYTNTMFLVEDLSVSNSWVKTYDVMSQQMQILFRNNMVVSCTLDVDVYLMA